MLFGQIESRTGSICILTRPHGNIPTAAGNRLKLRIFALRMAWKTWLERYGPSSGLCVTVLSIMLPAWAALGDEGVHALLLITGGK